MKYRIATPVSSLFEDNDLAKSLLSASDTLEVRDHSASEWDRAAELFHTELQLIQPWDSEDREKFNKRLAMLHNLKGISFHIATPYTNPKLLNGKFIPSGNKLNLQNMKANAEQNIFFIKKVVGDGVTLMIENNNFYATGAYDLVTEGDFLTHLSSTLGVSFLLDLAHARITATNKNMIFKEYLHSLPIDKVKQIHLSKHGISPSGEAFDAHDLPDHEVKDDLIYICSQTDVEYVTVEYYKKGPSLVQSLIELRCYLNEL